MTMDSLKDLIERCHQRHEKPLRQRRTVVTPALYNKSRSYQVTVYCAQRYPVLLTDMEQADISFMPISRAPEHDRGPRDFGGERLLKRQGIQDWGIRRWYASWGLQVYTGIPSERDGARWHDIDFKYEAICAAPDAIFTCLEALVNAVPNPLLTLSKSGGLRFSCRVPDYLHPNTEHERLYIYKHTSTSENPNQCDTYLEILGEEGCSRWDARYEILLGSLLDPPIIVKEVLFAPIDALRAELHESTCLEDQRPKPVIGKIERERNIADAPASLDSHNLDLAKEAFLKHGFSYIRQENGYHYWVSPGSTTSNEHVQLWESDGIVWVRASTPDAGLPTRSVPITDIWDDTGILPPVSAMGLPVSDEVLAVRKGQLSPLAIKRPPPVLQKPEHANNIYETIDTDAAQAQRILDGTSRILGLTTQVEGPQNHGVESHVLKGGTVCLNPPSVKLAEKTEQHFREQNLPSEKIQITTIPQLFFDPQYSEAVEEMLDPLDDTDQLCIVPRTKVHKLFPLCKLPKKVLENWRINWKGEALGNFATTLLHAVEIKDKPHAHSVKRIRTAMQVFEWQEEELVKQMCAVNVEGRVVKRGVIDSETGKELAHFTVEFEGGASAYIPVDHNAEDKLTAMELPFFQLSSFAPNENMKIQMPMAQAIQLGILDAETVENLHRFPTVCKDPLWTYWHQLKCFFAHYTRDADTPIRWNDKALRFWVPPVLHPNVKRLLLTSIAPTDQHLHRAFPDEEIKVGRIKPSVWVAGNRVFQIRTGVYPRQRILDYNSNRDVIGMSKTGQRFFAGIRAEIERDPSVKHAIITYKSIAARLEYIAEKENVCFVTDFEKVKGLNDAFKEAQVVWIVGTPQWPSTLVWRSAQILFGNDEKPLSYEEEETDTLRYKDERIQSVYEQFIVRVLTRTVLRAGLNRWSGKKVVLISSLALPYITDRPETLLFDWEDFEVAGGLDRLSEVIATRQRFETERDNLTAESSREKVEQVLGCSSRQANRVLQRLRGGKNLRVPFREQILSLLADGEKRTAEFVAAIEGHPKAIKNELKRLVDAGEIEKVRWGVYTLPKA